MAYFKFPQETIDTTGLATAANQTSNTNVSASTEAAIPDSATNPLELVLNANITQAIKAVNVIDAYGFYLSWYTGPDVATALANGLAFLSAPGSDETDHYSFPSTDSLFVRAHFAGDGSPAGGQLAVNLIE